MGVLGFLGCTTLVFRGNLHSLGSFEAVQTGLLLVGGAVVALVIVGTSFTSLGPRKNPGQSAATGVMGGLLAGLMVMGFACLWVLAAIIYMVEDCARGCR
jgi:hypothetical protein